MDNEVLVDADLKAAPPKPTGKQVAAVLVGNALSFYDFLTYAFFAAQIGRTFFPSDSAAGSLLASLAAFGAGFLMRPVGAWVIGRMGDRLGRKPAMILSFALMGVAVAGLSLTPSYAAIGIAAPILAVAFRMLQGFALGGEVGPSSAFLMEIAPPHRRGLYTSLQFMTQNLSVVLAGVVGLILSTQLSPLEMDHWGWRVALGLGVLIVPFGMMMRATLVETLHDHEPEEEATSAPGLRPYLKVAILALLVLAGGTVVSYAMTYINTYAQTTLGMAISSGFGATIVLGVTGMLTDPVGGALSDRYGRKPLMLIPTALLALMVLPSFWLLSHYRTDGMLYGVTGAMSIVAEMGQAAVLVAITEMLPRRIRSGALAVIYAVAISVFGGSTQFVVAWLLSITDNPMVPGWYMVVASVVAVIAILMMKETAPARLKLRAAPGVLKPA
jgi:MHS family citrate/tricarballylate:H+ symporter-like MFS transporter